MESTITDVPVIYVLGNHEYYKGGYPKTLNAIRNSASDSNFHVLEKKTAVTDDVTFHGVYIFTPKLILDTLSSIIFCQC